MAKRQSAIFLWADACRRLEQADRLQRQFFEPLAVGAQPNWAPPVDMVESGDDLLIEIALPGVEPRSVELGFAGGMLQVSATRAFPAASRRAVIRRLELPYGRFERRIALPAGHFDLMRTESRNGCLRIHLRKRT